MMLPCVKGILFRASEAASGEVRSMILLADPFGPIPDIMSEPDSAFNAH